MAHGTSFGGFWFGLHGRELSSSHLILEAQRGDSAAFEELVRDYELPVMKVALALTGSEDSARDVYCRVFADAFASLDQVDSRTSVFVWLHRNLVKHCLAFCRRSREVEPACVAADSAPDLARVLGLLPPTERVVFALKRVQGLKVSTLGEIFSRPPEYIEDTLRKAARRLQMRVALRILLRG